MSTGRPERYIWLSSGSNGLSAPARRVRWFESLWREVGRVVSLLWSTYSFLSTPSSETSAGSSEMELCETSSSSKWVSWKVIGGSARRSIFLSVSCEVGMHIWTMPSNLTTWSEPSPISLSSSASAFSCAMIFSCSVDASAATARCFTAMSEARIGRSSSIFLRSATAS